MLAARFPGPRQGISWQYLLSSSGATYRPAKEPNIDQLTPARPVTPHPPVQTIPESVLKTVREWTINIAKELKVVGLINIQFAVQDNVPYIIEANPRASR